MTTFSVGKGPTECSDLALTEENRALIKSFVQSVLVENNLDRLSTFIDTQHYIEHSPNLNDGLASLQSALELMYSTEHRRIDYQRVYRVLAEGDVVLCVTDGKFEGDTASFYDLFRVADGRIVEHWDTTEKVVPLSEWKIDNGKF